MFKIGNSKELPTIPEHLSNEGKDFVRKCLQRNPRDRPSASELLDHPFVKGAAPLERPIMVPEASDPISGITHGTKALVRKLFPSFEAQLYLCSYPCYHLVVVCLTSIAFQYQISCFIYTIEQTTKQSTMVHENSYGLSIIHISYGF